MACKNGKHNLIEITRKSSGFEIYQVTNWCNDCGAIVVDEVHDGRVYPGAVMKMKFPEIANNQSIRDKFESECG